MSDISEARIREIVRQEIAAEKALFEALVGMPGDDCIERLRFILATKFIGDDEEVTNTDRPLYVYRTP